MKLNDKQEEAAVKMLDFIEGRTDQEFFTLTGAAGTGKTVLLGEVLKRTSAYMMTRTAAAVSHAAKNVLQESLGKGVQAETVARWLGLRMDYSKDGEIKFKADPKVRPILADYGLAILDEASMIDDELYDEIMKIVVKHRIKLIVLGDKNQLPPVEQDHDSKFFDRIDARLTEPMRFTGAIHELGTIYRDEIENINNGYVGNKQALNEMTERQDKVEDGSGYMFLNNPWEMIEQVAEEIKNSDDINHARVLAYKNATVQVLNEEIRKRIYGEYVHQFEVGEVLLSNGGYSYEDRPVLFNGQLLQVTGIQEVTGPFGVPCYSLRFKDLMTTAPIYVVKDDDMAQSKYWNQIGKLKDHALRDPRQWYLYYRFKDSFAYFDYSASVNLYKAQGQSITNVYVMEGEVMEVKPTTLKQKFQALYVAMTRARKMLYIYNKNY